MKIRIIVVGKTKERFLQQGEAEFLKRLRRYIKYEIIVVRPVRIAAGINEDSARHTEGERILKKCDGNEWIVVLDSHGQQMSSEKFASFIRQRMNNGITTMTFIIGGTLGFAQNVLQRANIVLSLSCMTFTHEMTRLFLYEQIYRAFTILKGEKYHK
ncbi:23S rRNA (pseudouridine(1915)-N(3))-methyltransferase RlmH [candidate division KSB1 bacterium]|nr:23S rRNA (pseudouridine(1915)-N(3))-methyltransferase RlmH [candidate division KSB1 bacterium]